MKLREVIETRDRKLLAAYCCIFATARTSTGIQRAESLPDEEVVVAKLTIHRVLERRTPR